jgi:shikimate kinase
MSIADRNIVITGFMGTGKSTVGRIIAKRLDRTFIDTDEVIAQQVGISIPEIFARDGEKGFRLMERQLCRYLGAHGGLVIATGGGTLVDDGNREIMLASGFVVCLNATPQAIVQRLADTTDRPLSKGDWHGLLQKRRTAYAAIPYQVDTTDKTPEQVAGEILALWQNALQ